jgi:hypothetical protein
MKIDITLEHKDLINQVVAYLAMQGLKPAGEIRFIKKKTAKGKPQEYEIQISCEAGPIPDTCPTCHKPSKEPAAKASMADSIPIDGTHAESTMETPTTRLDEELGESMEPPVPSTEDAAGQRVPSIQSLVAKSRAIEESAARQGRGRPRGPTLMQGESSKPPTD